MKGELSNNEIQRDIGAEIGRTYKDIRPDKEMSIEELNDAVYEEFGKIAKSPERPNDGEKYTDNIHVYNGEGDREVGLSKKREEYKKNETSENIDNDDKHEKKGGSYLEIKKYSDGETHEVHHMPSDSASNLERDDGPAIKMDKEDHRKTASCGNSKEAREYREKQKELISEGKFREALQMDIDDIHDKFGDKYDEAIAEMLDYVDKLETEGKI